jgi:hypothetical protein
VEQENEKNKIPHCRNSSKLLSKKYINRGKIDTPNTEIHDTPNTEMHDTPSTQIHDTPNTQIHDTPNTHIHEIIKWNSSPLGKYMEMLIFDVGIGNDSTSVL